MLILKQNAANSVPTPPAGKGTIFLDDSDTLSVKTSDGNVETFPTVGASNAQVVFMNGTTLSGENALTYNFNTNVLTVSGNVAAGNVLTDNLLYANGTAWDLQQPGGTNTQVQFNDADSFGGSANFTFNKTTGNANVGNIGATNGVFTNVSGNGSALSAITGANVSGAVAFATTANAVAGANVSGTVSSATTAGTVTTAAQPNITSVGTLTSLSVTGNASAGNVSVTGIFSGNGSGLSAIAGGNVTGEVAFAATANAVAGGNVSGQVGNALVAGTVYTAAQPNITSVGTLTSLSVTGNASAGNISVTGIFSGNGSGLSAIAGANVTGEVGFAAVANSVAGGNVSGQVGNALVAGTVYTAAQPNITSVGTLTSLAVTGNASAGNISVTGIFSGNGSGLSAIAGGNVTGQVANALVAGTVYTAAQPNITSVGTLNGLTLGANLAMGGFNITGLATPSVSTDAATKQYVDDVAQGLNIHDSCAAATPDTLANVTSGTITYNNGTGGVNANLVTTGSFNLIDGVNVQTSGTRILVKNEANAAHNGIYTWANSTTIVRATDFNSVPEVEAGDFTFITGGTLYDNTGWVQTDNVTTIGTDPINFTQFSGAGTYQAGTGLTLTGPTFSVNASQSQITSVGTLTSLGVSGTITAANITANTGVFTGNGSGLSAIAGGNVTGQVSFAATANAVAGANVSGQVANALVAGTVYTAAQPNITSVGTLTSLAVTGNANVGNIGAAAGVFTSVSGNGSALSAITGANVTGQVSFAAVANSVAAANISGQVANALVAGTVYTAAQPNITSVGTLSSVAITGNATAGNVYANSGTIGASLLTGTLTTAAQPNITSTGTLTSLTVSGTTSGTTIRSTTGAFQLSVDGTSANTGGGLYFYKSITGSGTQLDPTLFAEGNSTVGNLYFMTGGSPTTRMFIKTDGNVGVANTNPTHTFSVTGTINSSGAITTGSSVTASTLVSNVATGTAPFTVTSTTQVANLNVATAGTAGTVTTAAQPNITSTGTLTSLTVSGNITAQANVTVSGYSISSVGTGISAAGSTQGTATALTKDINVVSTVSASQGVVLPTAVAGMRITVMNTSATAMNTYPASGAAINSLATNAAFVHAAGARLDFVATSTTQWYTMNATYA